MGKYNTFKILSVKYSVNKERPQFSGVIITVIKDEWRERT